MKARQSDPDEESLRALGELIELARRAAAALPESTSVSQLELVRALSAAHL